MTEEPETPQSSTPQPRSIEGWGIGLALGTGIGVAIGTALGNLGVGIAIGMAIGLAFALAFGAGKKRQAPDDAASTSEDPSTDDPPADFPR
jgi:predicted lipid-binding transport protein (Tim44 family)